MLFSELAAFDRLRRQGESVVIGPLSICVRLHIVNRVIGSSSVLVWFDARSMSMSMMFYKTRRR